LYWACEKKDPEVAKILIDHGANLEITELYGFTPLHLSSFMGNMEIAVCLLSAGAKVNSRNKSGATPLHLAAKGNHVGIAKLLLEHGGDLFTKDEKGYYPKDYAKSPEMMQALRSNPIALCCPYVLFSPKRWSSLNAINTY
jgi:ankyrin repeat protein